MTHRSEEWLKAYRGRARPKPSSPITPARKTPVKAVKAPVSPFPGLPLAIPEYRFAPPRRWRFDYAWTVEKVALEIDGAIWVQGRHTRGQGVLNDMEKLNEAAILGWKVIRCTPDQLKSGAIFDTLKRALDNPV